MSELGQSLSDFSKAVKLLGACEGDALGKAFSELGTKSEALSVKLQKEVGLKSIVPSVTGFSILFYGVGACPRMPSCLFSLLELLSFFLSH